MKVSMPLNKETIPNQTKPEFETFLFNNNISLQNIWFKTRDDV